MSGWVAAALIVAWVVAGALVALLLFSMKLYGDAIVRIDELYERLQDLAGSGERGPKAPPADVGLEVGTEAPAFELPDLDGATRRFADYLGEPFVLLFFSPTCGYCLQLSPQLGRLGDGRKVVVMTQGDLEQNRRLAADHGWECDALIEDDWAVIRAYETPATPSAYLVDAEGRIASPLVIGVEGVLALRGFEPMAAGSNGHGVAAALGSVRMTTGGEAVPLSDAAAPAVVQTRSVGESRIARDGLEAGTLAPSFVLPDLKGSMHSLSEYLDKPLLLVFSDVNCAPCEALAPRLVELNGQRAHDRNIVLIGRGDPEQNRAKAAVHGYEFPVLLQMSWEVSKQYAMFATPIAYLIDEQGVIAKDVAVGPDAIIGLAS